MKKVAVAVALIVGMTGGFAVASVQPDKQEAAGNCPSGISCYQDGHEHCCSEGQHCNSKGDCVYQD